MKTIRSICILIPLVFSTGRLTASPEVPAFRGAKGFGTYSNGGRGGDFYQVTNLEPNGPGSFLEAIPRGIVAKGTPFTIDLRKFTFGFVKNPVSKTSGLTGGSLKASGIGDSLVTFTPDHTGRAGPHLAVIDDKGSTRFQTFGLLVFP